MSPRKLLQRLIWRQLLLQPPLQLAHTMVLAAEVAVREEEDVDYWMHM